jgi:hypothetical protein
VRDRQPTAAAASASAAQGNFYTLKVKGDGMDPLRVNRTKLEVVRAVNRSLGIPPDEGPESADPMRAISASDLQADQNRQVRAGASSEGACAGVVYMCAGCVYCL